MKYIKHLIIGGGITGCYIGLQLKERNEPFLILEREQKGIQGKQVTIHPEIDQTLDLELGSSIIHTKQHNVFKIINTLNLSKNVIDLEDTGKQYYYIPGISNKKCKEIYKQCKQKVKNALSRFKPTTTLDEACKQILTEEEYYIYTTCYVDWFEDNDINVHIYFQTKEQEGDYKQLKGGLQQLLTGCADLLEDEIIYDNRVSKIYQDYNKYIVESRRKEEYQCDYLYVCVNLEAAKKINYIPILKEYLNCGISKECLRFYIILDKDIEIKKDNEIYGSISGDFELKWTFKVQSRIWMITYPDGKLAKNLYNKIQKGKPQVLITKWLKFMNKTFEQELSMKNIVYYTYSYWNDAYTVLNKEWYKNNIKLPTNLICTCLPKQNGIDTAWMEGHLYDI